MAVQDTQKGGEKPQLTKDELTELEAMLRERRRRILDEDAEQLAATKDDEGERMSDEVDLASVEYDQAFEHRIRDRERHLLRKIDRALERIVEGEYDECEECSSYIGAKRLYARPEATLCIECKEEQEQEEKQHKKRRQRSVPFTFK